MQTKTRPEDIQNYLADASNMPGGHAEKLFIPETAVEIADILRDANVNGIPVTISGARTGTVGGAIPFGGYVISLERLNEIKGIDREKMTAVVEPGVILADLQKAAEAQGLLYPPDPTEWSCQIGGTVATNASGARSFKYGATRNYIDRLQIVLADGDELHIKRGEYVSNDGEPINLVAESAKSIEIKVPTYARPDVRKNVSGFYNSRPLDAIDLFIGSEGTLGVITEIELKLLPKPEGFFSGIVFFRRESDLLSFVTEARARSLEQRPEARFKRFEESLSKVLESRGEIRTCAGVQDVSELPVNASLLEYFDGNALRFIAEKFSETPTDAAGAIYFEQETNSRNEDPILEQWSQLLEKHNPDLERSWFTTNDQDREKMRAFRHALPVTVNEKVVRNKQKKIGTDMAVPDENFASFLKFQKETLEAIGIEYVIFGHIGDCHLHANLLPKTDEEAVRARNIYGRFIAQAIMFGGCVSAEHGIGKLKRKYLDAMMGEQFLNEMAEIKRTLDPKGILARGNIFDEKYL